FAAIAATLAFASAAFAQSEPPRERPHTFVASDAFDLEYADNPQISPDGRWVAYVRVTADVMSDRFRRSIWLVDANGANHRPLVQGAGGYGSPVWAPNGRAIAYVANEESGAEVRIFYLDTQRSATITRVPAGAGNLTWSPDGRTLAFQSFVEEGSDDPAAMPPQPEGSDWAGPARVINGVVYRADGEGYLPNGYAQIFVVPADGGTPRQLTYQARNHDGRLSWSPNGRTLYFSANAEDGWEYDPVEADIYSLDITSGAVTRLTTRDGPENNPVVSPDGRRIAYVGFDDRRQGYQVSELYVANADGSNPRSITASLDRDVVDPQWAGDGAIYFLFDDQGMTKLGRVGPNGGRVTTVLTNIGGTDLGRPYTSGSYSVNASGRYVATVTSPTRPSDLMISSGRHLTALNEDLFTGKTIATAEHIRVPSTADQRPVDAWIVRPPDFDPSRQYPMLLEIHGGPFTAYGPVFSAEVQMYAAAGYIVVYANPRGSTSYGGEFGNLIHHNYPSQDYDDLMSVVDAVIARGNIDSERLFVTGGSGGGVLTAWIVGTTDRFAAAMVQKPVINWTSFVLTSDATNFFAPYWFGEMPWEEGAQERYWARSPLSRVGNVSTPTAVMVGDEDHRTPASEAEQYYTALRLRHVPTRLIRIPGAPHDIAFRPTGMIAKVRNTLAWFAEHGGPPVPDARTGVVAPEAEAH
ncbi:MAG: S9 family peptidase, partial [Hyphomonadaceae bacterium]|nr:S9 family peptidase [Hyphomonadaceae bacterium]